MGYQITYLLKITLQRKVTITTVEAAYIEI